MSLVDKIREWYKPNKVKSSFEILSVATGHKFDWLKKEVLLNGLKVEFILDSGAQISCINEHTWEKVGSPVLTKVNFSGKSYTGDEFAILGNFVSKVELNGVEENLLVYVTKEKMNLFGLPWIVNFEKRLGYPIVTSILQNEIKSMVKNNELVYVVESNSPENPDRIKKQIHKMKAHLHLKSEAKPVFVRARPVPIGVKKAVEDEIDRLLSIGAINPIEFANWAAPILAVKKANGKIRAYSKVQRLPFGVKSAPAIFQKLMDELISGLNGVFAYLDDLIIVSKNEREHKEVLFELFERIENYGLKIQLEKCNFFKSELKFLGHIVSKEGIKPDPEKKSIIQKLQRPKDVKELKSVMGTINYYAKFVREMHEVRGPLDKLLQKNIEWKWEDEQETSFEKINKSLSQSEKNYGQIEKEGLALVFAVQKFHKMLFGRKFKLRTDHKPLVSIFGNKKGIKVQTASRLQRWALILTNYDFDIEFVSTDKMGMADSLSRLINNSIENEDKIIALVEFDSGPPDEINQVEDTVKHVLNIMLEELPVDNKQIRIETENDQILKKVKEYICNGWPKQVENHELLFWSSRRQNLQIVDDCILFVNKVVIPLTLRNKILESLHASHSGIVRMKNLAREYVYWPGINKEIEEMSANCKSCQETIKIPVKNELSPWPVPNKSWERIHIDFAGPCKDGKLYMIIIDAYSKWPEVFTNTTTSAKDSIKNLELVSDNGSPFQSYEFKNYCKSKGINQVYSPPYHPQSNGQVERFVDYFKRMMKKNWGKSNWLQEVLLNYRATPHESLNGKSPAEEFLNKKLRIELSLVKPEKSTNSINNRREEIREKMKSWFDNHHGAKSRKYEIGDKVLFSNYSKNKNTEWLVGKIVNRNGVVYKIQSNKLRAIISRHINQLRNCKYNENQQSVNSWWKNRQNNIQINSPKINSPNERQIIRVDTAQVQ
uniref:RNA-directed DNA polymerase n=1 Tax=Meloidogyne hapla TaxID=6305 RepID=A0A1I8BHK6_MELHA